MGGNCKAAAGTVSSRPQAYLALFHGLALLHVAAGRITRSRITGTQPCVATCAVSPKKSPSKSAKKMLTEQQLVNQQSSSAYLCFVPSYLYCSYLCFLLACASLHELVSSLTPTDAALFKRCYAVLQESLDVSEDGSVPTTSLPKCITSAFVAGSKGKGGGTVSALMGGSPKKRKASLSVKTTGLPVEAAAASGMKQCNSVWSI